LRAPCPPYQTHTSPPCSRSCIAPLLTTMGPPRPTSNHRGPPCSPPPTARLDHAPPAFAPPPDRSGGNFHIASGLHPPTLPRGSLAGRATFVLCGLSPLRPWVAARQLLPAGYAFYSAGRRNFHLLTTFLAFPPLLGPRPTSGGRLTYEGAILVITADMAAPDLVNISNLHNFLYFAFSVHLRAREKAPAFFSNCPPPPAP
jgi:hypothetical protein